MNNKEKAESRLGEININHQGLKMIIIKYNNSNDIEVKFEDGTIKKCQYGNFKLGQLKNYNYKNIYGVACIGEGKYKSRNGGKALKSYTTWKSMLSRCYDKKYQVRHPTYKDCMVCEEWLNFQNFAEWYENNYYEIQNEIMHLDKDILIKNNKIYSPNTCCFVPQKINDFFTKANANRGEFPIGITYCGKGEGENYAVNCSNSQGKRYLGKYKTIKEAFMVYKQAKEAYIKQMAEFYKENIPKRLYEAMYNYKVEITD